MSLRLESYSSIWFVRFWTWSMWMVEITTYILNLPLLHAWSNAWPIRCFRMISISDLWTYNQHQPYAWSVALLSRNKKNDVICENLPYGVTTREGPDQKLCIMQGVWSGPTIFVAYEHLQKVFLSLPGSVNYKHYPKCIKTANLFVPP